MQSPSSSWATSNKSNFPMNTSNFRSNRKRKSTENDFEEKSPNKIFLTEEKLIKNMQTLSLDLSVNNPMSTSEENEEENETKFELHQLLKDNLKNDDLHDKFLNKICDFERKKLSMQIVPYMPIHPAQLKLTNEEKEQENQTKTKKIDNDDHLFKKPFLPTPYTVEEPSENTIKRTLRMKRSYSQSQRSNNNLSVVELKNDCKDYSNTQSDYLIFEPTTPVVLESRTNHFNSSYSPNQPSLRITEYFDDSSSSDNNDDIDIQSIVLNDITDNMDDDDDHN